MTNKKTNNNHPQFGEIYFANLVGGENIQSGLRPVVIAQNNVGNQYSSTVEVIPMSSKINKAKYLPTHVLIHPSKQNGLRHMSIVLAEQVVTINKKDILGFMGMLDNHSLRLIGEARRIQSPFLAG